MAPRTLSQAIDHLAALSGTFDPNAGPVLSPLLAACREVGEARTRLDGLEEARAMMAARGSAFEQAREHLSISDPVELGARLTEVVRLAAFLSPGNEVLEDPNIIDITHQPEPDPIADAEVEDRAELEASQAGALAQVDELTDKVAALERSNETKNATLRVSEELVASLELELAEYRDPSNWQRVALWGETFGRMLKDDAEKLSKAIQAELAKRSAAAQVADDRRRTVEADLANEKAEGDVAREHVTELAATLELAERQLAEERTKVIDLTERLASAMEARA